MTNEEFIKSYAGRVQELRGQYNAHIVNVAMNLPGNYDAGKAQAAIWDLLCKAIILEASAGLCYAIEDKNDTGGKTTKLKTTYRVLPGPYELVPSEVKNATQEG